MKIRVATSDDVAAVGACADRAFLQFTPPARHTAEGHDDDLLEQIRRENLHVISEGSDPTIVGYISLLPIADHMFVESIAVLPEHQNKGLGTRLLAFAEQEAARRGLNSVRLFTKQKTTDGFVFYKYRGYRETDRCDSDGFPRVFYSKDISPNHLLGCGGGEAGLTGPGFGSGCGLGV